MIVECFTDLKLIIMARIYDNFASPALRGLVRRVWVLEVKIS